MIHEEIARLVKLQRLAEKIIILISYINPFKLL
jgi:hypothetical protein